MTHPTKGQPSALTGTGRSPGDPSRRYKPMGGGILKPTCWRTAPRQNSNSASRKSLDPCRAAPGKAWPVFLQEKWRFSPFPVVDI